LTMADDQLHLAGRLIVHWQYQPPPFQRLL
jgi:hypothetical protein